MRPRPERDRDLVGAVTGTGPPGLRAAGFPDLVVFDADMLLDGQDGVRYWEYVGPDWGLKTGDLLGPSALH